MHLIQEFQAFEAIGGLHMKREESGLYSLCQTFPHSPNLPLPLSAVSYERYHNPQHRGVTAYLGQGSIAFDDPALLYFLANTGSLVPPGWSIVVRDSKTLGEHSFGFWWPIALRPFEHLLSTKRVSTVHVFAGSNQRATATMAIRWQEEDIHIHWRRLDRAFDEEKLSYEQLRAGKLDEEITRRLPYLIPGGDISSVHEE